MKDRDNILFCFALVNSEFPPLQYPPKSGPLFSQSTCAFEHIFICFSHADGNLGRKVVTPLHVFPLTCCQVSTTFFINPAFSLGFSWSWLCCHQWKSTITLFTLLIAWEMRIGSWFIESSPIVVQNSMQHFTECFKKIYSLEAAASFFPGSEI